MTVIVYRDGIMAADSAITVNKVRPGIFYDKIFKHRNKIYGMAGHVIAMDAFKQYIIHGQKIEDEKILDGDYEIEVLEVDIKTNEVFIHHSIDGGIPFKAEYYAIGSADQIALGALAAGCSAIEAVEIACKHHITCSLPVFSFDVKEHIKNDK